MSSLRSSVADFITVISSRSFDEEISDTLSSSLPEEILFNIFSRLCPRDLANASCVNQQWYNRSNQGYLWKELYLRDFSDDFSPWDDASLVGDDADEDSLWEREQVQNKLDRLRKEEENVEDWKLKYARRSMRGANLTRFQAWVHDRVTTKHVRQELWHGFGATCLMNLAVVPCIEMMVATGVYTRFPRTCTTLWGGLMSTYFVYTTANKLCNNPRVETSDGVETLRALSQGMLAAWVSVGGLTCLGLTMGTLYQSGSWIQRVTFALWAPSAMLFVLPGRFFQGYCISCALPIPAIAYHSVKAILEELR